MWTNTSLSIGSPSVFERFSDVKQNLSNSPRIGSNEWAGIQLGIRYEVKCLVVFHWKTEVFMNE
jgi:hypothetical protein